MKRYAVTVVACLLVATVAFSLGVGVKPVELPPPIGLVDEAGSRSGEGAGERRMRASGAVAQRGARVRGDRRRSRPRPAAAGRAQRRDGARRPVRRSRASAGVTAHDGAGDDDVASEPSDGGEADADADGAAPEPSDGGEEDAGADGAALEPSNDGEDDADSDDQPADRDDGADDPDD
jgi:hypothetical protein